MKKVFMLFVALLLLPISVFAVEVSDAAGLKSALESGQSVELAGDITLLASDKSLITTTTSRTVGIVITGAGEITIEGNGHKISTSALNVLFEVKATSSEGLTVNFNNIVLEGKDRVIDTRSDYITLNLTGANLKTTGTGNTQGITAGGYANLVTINIYNSEIDTRKAGYGIITFNPVRLLIDNSVINGYGALYFKGIDGSVGSKGSIVTIRNNSHVLSENNSSTVSNDFGTIVFEDDDIIVNVEDSKIESTGVGTCVQSAFLQRPEFFDETEKSNNSITVKGDSEIVTSESEDIALFDNMEIVIEPGVSTNAEVKEEYLPAGSIVVTRPDGSFAVATQYQIAFDDDNNGLTTTDKLLAAAGEKVTLTTKANEGYLLGLVEVYDANGNKLTITDNTFTMPESDVKVVSRYNKIYNITTDINEGTIELDKVSAVAGETVTFNIVKLEGYVLTSYGVFTKGGEKVTINNMTFVMPNDDVVVTAEYAKEYAVNVNADEGAKTEVDKTTAIKGEEVTIKNTIKEGYVLVSLTVTDEEGNKIEVKDDKFVMPESKVLVEVKTVREYSITVEENKNVDITLNKEVSVAGKEITISLKAKEGHEIKSVQVLDEDGKEIEVTDGKFTMPEGNVTIKVATSEIKNPNTADNSFVTTLGMVLIASAGLAYALKKRRFS